MRPLRVLRRAIRVFQSSTISPTSPKKHIKIDDEESHSEDYLLAQQYHPRSVRLFKMLLVILTTVLTILFLFTYVVYKPPNLVISFFKWKNPSVLFNVPVPASRRIVALTLDDAPGSETSTILDLLKSYGAKATFFVIGSHVASHPGILQRIHDEGHEIGNHAWKDEASIQLPLSELERQIREVEALLPPNTPLRGSGLAPKYFRPGSGFFNKKMIDKISSLGYRTVLGNVYPHDPQIPHPRVNAKHVLSMVQPGSIIIMHDHRSYSPEQLELVLKGLQRENWEVESIGGLLTAASEGQKVH